MRNYRITLLDVSNLTQRTTKLVNWSISELNHAKELQKNKSIVYLQYTSNPVVSIGFRIINIEDAKEKFLKDISITL